MLIQFGENTISRLLLLSVVTLILLVVFYTSSTQSPSLLSSQGCRMSWMYPSYVLQPEFNTTWTRLSRRYSLWLYRESGWEPPGELNGLPVLFIPGNAGSSRQVRSIASSATTQYYNDPHIPNPDFISRGIKPLDFFTVEFNEDFSALHGPTLLSERSYTSAAIKYILSLYPPYTQIILMGHSMGGIVALSLLPSPDISAIITMSTPNSLPPARLDRRIEDIYSDSWGALRNDSTPVLSVCGGATDLMIPSETCVMDQSHQTVGWRKTVFTSCMEGTWTGVGHREMVWCHQVRWRVARAALELSVATTDAEKGAILGRWFQDGLGDNGIFHAQAVPEDISLIHVPPGQRLTLRDPPRLPHMYMLPLFSASENSKFTLYVSRGSVASVSPHHASDLAVSVYRCVSSDRNCQILEPLIVKLIPNLPWGAEFPVPREGVDESDGVVFFEAALDPKSVSDSTEGYIGVLVQGGGDQGSWVCGGIDREHSVQSNAGKIIPFREAISIPIDPAALTTKIKIPNVLVNALLVYRIVKLEIVGSCSDALLPPLIHHISGPIESHFHQPNGTKAPLIHSHTYGPFLDIKGRRSRGIDITIHSSGECGISHLGLAVDWWSSLGRWGLRYWTTVCAWTVGVVGVMIFQAWCAWENGGFFPTISVSLTRFTSTALLPLSGVLLFASLIPLDSSILLGNSGEPVLSLLAPLLLLIASGCVTISWYFLRCIMALLFKAAAVFGRENAGTLSSKQNLWSLGVILILVATVIPSQVAFLACFLIHLFSCAVQSPTATTYSPLVEAHTQKTYLLLLLFWLLPLVVPVLAVWVRTLATVGLTTPFDGDHDVFSIASFLLLVELAFSSTEPLFKQTYSRLGRRLTSIVLCSLAVVPFAFGGRYTYRVYLISNIAAGYAVVARIIAKRGRWMPSSA